MERIISIVTITCLFLSLNACGGGNGQDASPSESPNLISEVCARLLCQEAAPAGTISNTRCGKIARCETTCEECIYNGHYSGDCATLEITVTDEGLCTNAALEMNEGLSNIDADSSEDSATDEASTFQ